MSDEPGELCLWCGALATTLCDTWIGCVPSPEHGLRDIDGENFTCDAPMCDQHRHFLGRIGDARRPDFYDTIDVCPEHVTVGLSVEWSCAAKNRSAARAVRVGIAALANRSRFRLVP